MSKGLTLPDRLSRPLNFESPTVGPGDVGKARERPNLIAPIMLDPRDWDVIFEVYAREPTSALALAFQLVAIKMSLKRGAKGIPDALTGLNQAIESLYPHTDFHKMGRRLYYRTIQSTITSQQENLITALKKTLQHSKRKPMVKDEITAKKKSQISLVTPVEKAKPAKKQKASEAAR